MSFIDIKGANDIHRHTVGARLQAKIPAGALVDIEMPFQFGETGTTTAGTRTIRAYAFHADVSKSFEKCPWKPKLAVGYDEASGDKDPNDSVNNTFVPLYQSTHAPYGLMDLFRWQNMRNPEVSLTFSPMEKLKVTPQADLFWLQSKFDNWYNSSGGNVRTKTSGERGYYVGSEVSLRAGLRGQQEHQARIRLRAFLFRQLCQGQAAPMTRRTGSTPRSWQNINPNFVSILGIKFAPKKRFTHEEPDPV